jgi:hypothetical protein
MLFRKFDILGLEMRVVKMMGRFTAIFNLAVLVRGEN